MSLVSPYDVEDDYDLVLTIKIHGEFHAVALDGADDLPDEIDPPEQCDGCGSTVSEAEELEAGVSRTLLAGDMWPLLYEPGSGWSNTYRCSRPGCGHVYLVHRQLAADTVF